MLHSLKFIVVATLVISSPALANHLYSCSVHVSLSGTVNSSRDGIGINGALIQSSSPVHGDTRTGDSGSYDIQASSFDDCTPGYHDFFVNVCASANLYNSQCEYVYFSYYRLTDYGTEYVHQYQNFALNPQFPEGFKDSLVGRYVSDILGRPARSNELDYYGGRLEHGYSEFDVAYEILFTTEKLGIDVKGYFRAFLQRDPLPAGLAAYVQWLAGGATQEQVAIQLLNSKEYFRRNGGTKAAFIRALYRDLLARAPSPKELNIWLNALKTRPRSFAVPAFVYSDGYRRRLIRGWYLRYFKVNATLAAQNYWLGAFRQGRRQEAIQADMLSSVQYVGD